MIAESRCIFHPDLSSKGGRGWKTNLFVDLLQEGDLLLQRLDASLQVQTGQSGSIHVL